MKIGGQIPWNVTPFRKVTDLLSDWKTPYERRFGQPSKRQIVPFGSLVESPCDCEGSVANPSIWKESLTWIVPRIRIVRVEYGRMTYWSQTLRSWRRWTHRKSTWKDSMRMRWYFPKKRENLDFQSKVDESKPLEEIRIWEHPPWYDIDQFKERVILIFLENEKDLFHNFTTHFRMPVKR